MSRAPRRNLRAGRQAEDRRPIHVQILSNGCPPRNWLTNLTRARKRDWREMHRLWNIERRGNPWDQSDADDLREYIWISFWKNFQNFTNSARYSFDYSFVVEEVLYRYFSTRNDLPNGSRIRQSYYPSSFSSHQFNSFIEIVNISTNYHGINKGVLAAKSGRTWRASTKAVPWWADDAANLSRIDHLETIRLYNRVAQEDRAESSRDFSLRPVCRSTTSNKKGRGRGSKERRATREEWTGRREEREEDEAEEERGRTSKLTTLAGVPGDPVATRATEARSHLARVYRYEDEERVIEVAEEAIPGRACQDVLRETTNRQCYAVWTSSSSIWRFVRLVPPRPLSRSRPSAFLLARFLPSRARPQQTGRRSSSYAIPEKDDPPLHVQMGNHGTRSSLNPDSIYSLSATIP